MPFALVTVGLILVITGVRDTYAALGSQVKSDFTGQGNFMYWIAALGIVGSVGYIDRLRGFANMFMALIIIAMVLKNGGVFAQFKSALANGPVSPAQNASTNTGTQNTASLGNIANTTYAQNSARDQGYIQDAEYAAQAIAMFA